MVQEVKKRLVPNWRSAWKWFSVQAMVLSAALQMGWAELPDDLKQHIDAQAARRISVALLVLGVAGRVIKQKEDDHGTNQERS